MSATTELAERPKCNRCGQYLDLRTVTTPEQDWCGVWYDHPPVPAGHSTFGHTHSTLYPSRELMEAQA